MERRACPQSESEHNEWCGWSEVDFLAKCQLWPPPVFRVNVKHGHCKSMITFIVISVCKRRKKYLHFVAILQYTSLLLWSNYTSDTYFHNGIDSYLHAITRPNKLLRISENGDITYSMRWGGCSLSLIKVPTRFHDNFRNRILYTGV